MFSEKEPVIRTGATDEVPAAENGLAVRVRDLGKCYQIYDRPQDRLKQSLHSKLDRLLGRPPRLYFHEFWALKAVSFDIQKGETVGIIGRNGSGKSTLLQILCGTLSPTTGSVETGGRVAALLELGAGFNPEFTGRENVYLNASVLGLSRREIDNRLDAIVAFADIGEFFEQPVKMYSSGMYVRLAFAIASHVDADLLIVDEALAVGDMVFQHKCMAKIRRMLDDGLTLLFVSHDPDAVRAICRSALWLDGGNPKMWGSAINVSRAYFENSMLEVNKTRVEFSNYDANATGARARDDLAVGRVLLDATRDLSASRSLEVGPVRVLDAQGRTVDAVSFGEVFAIEVSIQALVGLDDLNVSFIVKDHLGIELTGESLFNKQRRGINLASGEAKRIRFTGKMWLRGGVTYSVSLRVNRVSRWDRSDLIHLYADDTAAVFHVLGDTGNPVWYRVYQPFAIRIDDIG